MAPVFRYLLRVRYGECDAQKVVFNSRYGDYVDLAVTEYFRALGYGEQLASGELDYQLVKQLTEWRAPARFDQVLEIGVRCARLGTTSFALGCEFRIAGTDGRAIASSETVYVLVDHLTLAKRTLPEGLRARMIQGTDAVTDHAAFRGAA
ncbi:MAG TPA: acyl-CoA thioesterase [Solimonas sp.]|nr:acyl-CoA thioesterase [Solimonas sp.]